MPRPGSTTAKGLGWEHQQARAAAIRTMRNGEPCPYCGLPMTSNQPLDFDHYPPRAIAGNHKQRRLTHRGCNRRAGQALGQQLRRQSRSPRRSRDW